MLYVVALTVQDHGLGGGAKENDDAPAGRMKWTISCRQRFIIFFYIIILFVYFKKNYIEFF